MEEEEEEEEEEGVQKVTLFTTKNSIQQQSKILQERITLKIR